MKKFVAFFKRSMSCETLSYSQVMGIIIPVIVDTVLTAGIGMINTAMVSSSGPGIVSATSLTGSINSIFQCFFTAAATGGSILISQYKGRGDYKKLRDSMGELFSVMTVMALVVTAVLVVFGSPIFRLLYGTLDDEVVLKNGVTYLIGISISYPLFTLYQSSSATLRALGDGKACMAVSLTASIVNILSNCITIYWLNLGILGIIISGTVNRITAVGLSLFLLRKFHPELDVRPKTMFKHNNEDFKRLVKVSSPFILEQIFYNGGNLVNSSFMARCGAVAVEATAIMGSMSIYMHPTCGIENGSVSIIGQCVGAGRKEEARRMLNNCILFSTAITAGLLIVLLPSSKLLMSAYSPSAEAAEIIPGLFAINGLGWLIFGASHTIGASGLRASGDAFYTSMGAMIAMWVVKIGLGYLLAIQFGLGVYGMVIASVSEWVARAIMFTIRRYSRHWCAKKLI
jgi:putative MATE family efflux protein